MAETLLEKAKRLGIKPGASQDATASPTAPAQNASVAPKTSVSKSETLIEKAQRLGIQPAAKTQQPEEKPGFIKSLLSPVATTLARPIQAIARIGGVSPESIDKFSKEKLGGYVAPLPQTYSDVKKDVGRAVQTVALGMPGLALGGAAFGVGSSLESGNDLFSAETAFQAAVGIGGAKLTGLIGKPLIDASGKVIGKITPQVIKDVAAKGSSAIQEFAAKHNILPETVSKAINTGADKLETAVNKPFEVAGRGLNAVKESYAKSNAASTIAKREQEIFNIENNYAKTRKAMAYSKDANAASRRRIAETDVLADAVDQEGKLITKNKGGAIDKYKAQTIDGKEEIVRTGLEREGATTDLATVRNKLRSRIMNSGLEGTGLTNALKNVDKELRGIALRARSDGKIPLTVLHDAKIATTNGINYMTEPFVKSERKAIARAYKELIEDLSSTDVKKINAELQKYYQDLELLENLDGRRVKGGRLGKYFAQISGNLIGGVAGAAVGGPAGAAVGTVLGGEAGSIVKGNILQRTLGGKTGGVAPVNEVLESALKKAESPRLMLPAPKPGAPRSSVGSGKPISLPARSQSTVDAQELKGMKKVYENSFGKRQSPNSANKTTTKSIKLKVPKSKK